MDAELTVVKRVLVTEEDARLIKQEVERNPHLYRTSKNQISEAELVRRAVRFYLSGLFVQSNIQSPTPADEPHAAAA